MTDEAACLACGTTTEIHELDRHVGTAVFYNEETGEDVMVMPLAEHYEELAPGLSIQWDANGVFTLDLTRDYSGNEKTISGTL